MLSLNYIIIITLLSVTSILLTTFLRGSNGKPIPPYFHSGQKYNLSSHIVKTIQYEKTKDDTQLNAQKEKVCKKILENVKVENVILDVNVQQGYGLKDMEGDIETVYDEFNPVGDGKFHAHNTLEIERCKHTTFPLVDRVMYINLEECPGRRNIIEYEISSLFRVEDGITVDRILASREDSGELGILVSHISALSLAYESESTVMVLEDDFEFYKNRLEITECIEDVKNTFEDRWDVIVLGKYSCKSIKVHTTKSSNGIIRLLQSDSTSGYIVNKNYIPTLLNLWIDHMYGIWHKEELDREDHLDVIQKRIQNSDTWLGFTEALGGHRNVFSDSKVDTTVSDKPWFNVTTEKEWCRNNIGVYIVVNSQDLEEPLNTLLRHLYLKSYKGDNLQIAVMFPSPLHTSRKNRQFKGVHYFEDKLDDSMLNFLQGLNTVSCFNISRILQNNSIDTFINQLTTSAITPAIGKTQVSGYVETDIDHILSCSQSNKFWEI